MLFILIYSLITRAYRECSPRKSSISNKGGGYIKQRRWLELLEEFDMSILYHQVKANVVDNYLSRLSIRRPPMFRKIRGN